MMTHYWSKFLRYGSALLVIIALWELVVADRSVDYLKFDAYDLSCEGQLGANQEPIELSDTETHQRLLRLIGANFQRVVFIEMTGYYCEDINVDEERDHTERYWLQNDENARTVSLVIGSLAPDIIDELNPALPNGTVKDQTQGVDSLPGTIVFDIELVRRSLISDDRGLPGGADASIIHGLFYLTGENIGGVLELRALTPPFSPQLIKIRSCSQALAHAQGAASYAASYIRSCLFGGRIEPLL